MQRLEVSGAVRPIYGSLGVKRLRTFHSGTVLNVCILQKHAMLQCISLAAFGDLQIIDNLCYA